MPVAKALRTGVSMIRTRGTGRPREMQRFSTRLYSRGFASRSTPSEPVTASMMPWWYLAPSQTQSAVAAVTTGESQTRSRAAARR